MDVSICFERDCPYLAFNIKRDPSSCIFKDIPHEIILEYKCPLGEDD
jgi:hypothetical protein